MVVESLAILIIFLVMVVMFLRSKKRKYAILTLPLLIVPLTNILFNVVRDLFKMSVNLTTHMFVLIVALAAAVLVIGFLTHIIKLKKTKFIYCFTCAGFTTILTVIFLHNLYIFTV